MTLIDRLDAAANKTGIPGMATRLPRRRRFRWVPIFALLVGFAAYVVVLASPGAASLALSGIVLVQTLSAWLTLVGPLKQEYGTATIDEFDRERGRRSYMVALGCIAFFAFVGMLFIAGLTLLLGWDREMLLTALIATALMTPLLWATIPTLHASWTLPAADPDDDD